METKEKGGHAAKSETQRKDNVFYSQSIAFESFEVEKLKKLIDNKKEYLKKLDNKKAFQLLQAEIMFLQNDILPATQIGSSIYHMEIARYTNRAYENGIKFRCNGVIIYLPISDKYKERPKIGIMNCNDLPFGADGAILLSGVEITNMDGTGTDNVETVILPLN